MRKGRCGVVCCSRWVLGSALFLEQFPILFLFLLSLPIPDPPIRRGGVAMAMAMAISDDD